MILTVCPDRSYVAPRYR